MNLLLARRVGGAGERHCRTFLEMGRILDWKGACERQQTVGAQI